MAARKCTYPGCDGKHYGRGLCGKHYQRQWSTGSLELKTKTVEQRFREKYLICQVTGCWNWTAGLVGGGYGKFFVDGKTVLAHRFSWELHVGPIPEGDGYHGICVCHDCPSGDNPACVNPEHLFLGTNQDNVDDRSKKGRHVVPKGSAHARAKLTEEQALEIYHSKDLLREIAARYGVGISIVSQIKTKQRWKHIHNGS